MPNPTLYFAYASFLDPDRIGEVAPGAKFLFTAHYPETKLGFVHSGTNRATATLTRDPAHTVWGGVFEIPDDQVEALVSAEANEGRSPGFDHKAVDREGNKYDCLAFVAAGSPDDHLPTTEYLDSMIRGARHWSLPAGWVMGLEDLEADTLRS
ncbi:MAG: gamma-glutamylcyclotransferase family protein [Acidimicrobiia bacterium]|nr:gamma-glutamylcyclotransferase [Acidobacteriota bacterium]MCZ6506218.1 gamma-glutamylcyclotransferase [Actinomycetota bacterium]MCZ6737913.1 gamma-glutamylcyclotransferase [Actinomycetota bacterium]TDI37909.1 MAG: gamma-glutamylcyclotransferase [Acidobacteriota bacterium]